MAQPPAYIITEDFSQSEAVNAPGRGAVDTNKLDNEFTNIKAFVDAIRENLVLLQRDDGKIRDQLVNPESLSADLLSLMIANFTPRGAWTTTTAYVLKDIVDEAGTTYMCQEAHTSGVFATDLAALKWILIGTPADPATVKTQYEANTNTNAFTDAEQSKLSGIEAGATDDQTGAEIKTAYEGEANTNEFSDAEQTKLSGISTGAEVNPDVVSQAEAEAGTATTERIWTAERVKQAVQSAPPKDYGGPINLSTGSPETVTLFSGLANVHTIEMYLEDVGFDEATCVPLIQIGDAGGIETSGYDGEGTISNPTTRSQTANTTGFLLGVPAFQDAAEGLDIFVVLRLLSGGSNLWSIHAVGKNAQAEVFCWGTKTLSGALDRVLINSSFGSPATFVQGNFSGRTF